MKRIYIILTLVCALFLSGQNIYAQLSERGKLPPVKVENIDAEKVELENCEVDEIKCRDAFIGSNCIVEKLFVANKEEISSDSQVGEIIHQDFKI